MPPTAGSSTAEQPRFYYDLASPESYLVAERALHALGEVPEWIPVERRRAGVPLRGGGRRPTRRTSSAGRRRSALMELRWPDAVPGPGPELGAAGRDLREVDRPRRRVLARRAAPGVRRRARPVRARQRPDRRRGVRDAPGRGDQGRRAGEHAPGAGRGATRARAPTASTPCPRSGSTAACCPASARSRS